MCHFLDQENNLWRCVYDQKSIHIYCVSFEMHVVRFRTGATVALKRNDIRRLMYFELQHVKIIPY